MPDTKKQHYVPQCYLKYFANEQERINVFDKSKMEVRRNQDIANVATKHRFYDLNLSDIFAQGGTLEKEKIKTDLAQILGVEDKELVESYLKSIDEMQYIETEFFAKNIESIYGVLLDKIIQKDYPITPWVIKNCHAISKIEKEIFSLFIAIQIIRTKSFRDTLGSMLEQFIGNISYKLQMNEKDAIPPEDFEVTLDKDYVKFQHAGMILDPEMAQGFADVLSHHIWVVYVNNTEQPFYTSDDPIVNIPHKRDEFISYGGLNSEGIEILFPLSSNLLLGMYHHDTYSAILNDRMYVPVNTIETVNLFNRAQVIHCQRCVFSFNDNFEYARQICIEKPDIRTYKPRIEVI